MTMKRTCIGCLWAYTRPLRGGFCEGGYSTQTKYHPNTGKGTIRKPSEECPKPKTAHEYVNAKKKQRESQAQ